MKPKIYTNDALGYHADLDTYAQLCDGAVWIKKDNAVILATVTSEKTQDFPGFMPLSVEYRELFSATGKIPGGYFKREGKPTEREVLSGRVIDRCIRPLFPDSYFDKIAVIASVYSVDEDSVPLELALVGASLALCSSKVPFMEPVGCCRVARVNGQWKVHPVEKDLAEADTSITVGGTEAGINMVEGSCNSISEKELLDAMFLGHEEIKKQVAWQKEVLESRDVKKSLLDEVDFNYWNEKASEFLTLDTIKPLFTSDKNARSEAYNLIKNSFIEKYKTEIDERQSNISFIENVCFHGILKKKICDGIFEFNHRIDGRQLDEVRELASAVAMLPQNHGSASFKRGSTQVLASATLGSDEDELKIETALTDEGEAFMLHYNFLPFSVGDAQTLRAPSRRSIGHGNLAASGIRPVLPSKKDFPYVIRVVAEVLASDGSTSMATVCSSSMALMDAGVPVKDMVAGVAMGMLEDSKGNFHVLTDITGFEDHSVGFMDFKVVGTHSGVTAIQMDIKYQGGLTRDVFENALSKALNARIHILKSMEKVIAIPRSSLSPLVPQFVTLNISTDKIGAVIGSGGKVIKEITQKTDTSINISDDGLVKIFGMSGKGLEDAAAWVKALGGLISEGDKFSGIVKRAVDFGYFVELVPGLDGLIHKSSLPKQNKEKDKFELSEGDKVEVVVLDYDPLTGRIRLKIVE